MKALPKPILLKLVPIILLNLVLAGAVSAQQAWDITDTGIPFREVTISTSEGSWMSVDVSPDGKTLVFDMLGDLYIMPVKGGEATLISGGPSLDRQPRFSPDGSRIVFTSDRSGQYNIWVSDTDGQNARQVSTQTMFKLSSANWSPDGQYIAAQRLGTGHQAPDYFFTIALYHIDGGIGREVVAAPHPGLTVNEAVFGPEGKSLYYTRAVAPVKWDSDPNNLNYVIKQLNLGSGESETLLGGFGSATAPQISRDGKRIAFVRRLRDKTVLFVYDREAGEETPIYQELSSDLFASPGQDGFYPQYSWFPDNRSLAIWAKGKLRRLYVDEARAEDIPFTATATHKISQVARYQRDELVPEVFDAHAIFQMTTAPDKQSIVFSALGYLWKKALPDGKPQRLTKGDELEFEPSFSPDGKRIAYVTWSDETGGKVKVVSSRGGRGKTIGKSSAALREPTWSPEQKKIAWFVGEPDDMVGGYHVKSGVYWSSVKGGESNYVAKGTHPSFSADGKRLYYSVFWADANQLKSALLSGHEEHTHAKSATARDFRLSPDGNWLAFSQYRQLYVIPYKEVGKALSVAPNSPELRVAKVSKHAGWAAHWTADSSQISWMLGDEYYSASVSNLFSTGRGPAGQYTALDQGTAIGLQVKSDIPEGALAFTNARIITMEGDEVIERGTVLVEGNRIVEVGTSVQVPDDATVMDLSGKTIMPGLIDMHGHLFLHRMGMTPQQYAPFYAALAHGVTTDFDVSTDDFNAATSIELVKSGRMVGPRYTGTGTTTLGPPGSKAHVPINSVSDAQSVMRTKRELGYPAIKSYRMPTRRQKQQLIKAALENEIMVMPEGEFNVYNRIGMILDGHTTIEHHNIMRTYYDDWVQLYAEGETALTPTMIVTGGELFAENYFYATTKPWQLPKVKDFVQSTFSLYNPYHGTPSQPPWVRGMRTVNIDESLWEIGVRQAARSMKKLSDAGVLINTGAHGQINGLAMHWEIWLLEQGGMTPLQALRAATMNPATTMGLENQLGSIRAGKLADLIVLDENPLENIRNTNSVTHTMVNGRLYDAFSMDEVGNYNRPRSKFFWEIPNYNGIDWNKTEAGADGTHMQEALENPNNNAWHH